MHEKDKLFENAVKMVKGAQVLELPILLGWLEIVFRVGDYILIF